MSHMVEPTEGWTSHVSVTELKVTEGPCGLWFPESTPPVTFQAQSRAGPRFLPPHLHARTHTHAHRQTRGQGSHPCPVWVRVREC